MNKEYLEGKHKSIVSQAFKVQGRLLLNKKSSNRNDSRNFSIDSFCLPSDEEENIEKVLPSINNPFLTDLPKKKIKFENRRPYTETIQFDEKEPYLYQDVLTDLEELDPFKPIEFGKTAMTNFYQYDSGHSNFELTSFGKDRFIMNSKKRRLNIGANYTISVEEGQFNRANSCFIAKLRSNYSKNVFNLFDTGLNPKKTKEESKRRRVLCTVGVKLFTNKGFRWFPEF